MMWIAAVAVCGLLGFCVAEEYYKPSYSQPGGKPNYPQPGGKPNYPQPGGKPNYPQPSDVKPAENRPALQADYDAAQIDYLKELIDRLHDRKLQQNTRLRYLKEASSRNRAFQNKVEALISKDINEDIEEQNERFGRLDEKLARVQDLKSKVTELQQLAQEIRNSTEDTVARDKESARSVAGNLDQEIVEEINNENDQAQRIALGLQEVLSTSFNNSRILNQQESRLDQIEARLNYSTAQATPVNITLDSQGYGNETISYPGFPEDYTAFLTGLHHIRSSGKYGAGNPNGDIEIEIRIASPGENELNALATGDTPGSYVLASVIGVNFIGSEVD